MRVNPSHLPWLEELASTGYGNFEDYYPESAEGTLEVSDPYVGRHVIWDGITGRTMRVYPNYITAIRDNTFDPDKLAAIVSGIDNASDRVVFTAPYGTASVITPIHVKESIEYGDEAFLDRQLTTGDDELDDWLVNPELVDRSVKVMERRLKKAVKEEWGDLGKVAVNIRDGNHRAFGALIAGEPYIWMILSDNQFQQLDRRDKNDRKILDLLE